MAQNQTGRFSLLIAVSMVLCTYFIFTATANEVSAESSGKLDILLNSEKEPTNGVYELVYSVENAQNIVSQDVTVNYNDKDFSMENVEMMVDEHYHLWSESDMEPGKHRFILSSVTENYGITGTKPILKLTLKAKMLQPTLQMYRQLHYLVMAVRLSRHLQVKKKMYLP